MQATRSRKQPQRFVGLLVKPGDNFAGVVRITVGKLVTDYSLLEIPSDLGGRGFRLDKLGDLSGESYLCLVGSPHDDSCTCRGYSKWSHCKHSEALAALIQAGRL
jgi:hypothetical protein